MRILKSVLDIPFFWNLTQFIFGCDKQKRFLYRAAFREKGRILDFGCADGNTFPAFSDFEYYGIDINERLLNHARNKYSSFGNTHFINADILEEPFPEDFFDHVLFACTGHHLERERLLEILKELIRVLKRKKNLHIFDTIRVPDRDSAVLRFIINLDQGKFMKDEKTYGVIFKELSDKIEVVKTETFRVRRFMPLPTFFHAELRKK